MYQPDEDLAAAVEWMVDGDTNDLCLRDFEACLLRRPGQREFARHPWARAAWSAGGARRAAAVITTGLCDRDSAADGFAALEEFFRRYVVELRRSLADPATLDQIGEALATVTRALDQSPSKAMARAIVETIAEAELSVYVVEAIFKRVMQRETGKLKPGSFTPLVLAAARRFEQLPYREARAFVRDFEAGWAYFRERMAEKSSFQPTPPIPLDE